MDSITQGRLPGSLPVNHTLKKDIASVGAYMHARRIAEVRWWSRHALL